MNINNETCTVVIMCVDMTVDMTAEKSLAMYIHVSLHALLYMLCVCVCVCVCVCGLSYLTGLFHFRMNDELFMFKKKEKKSRWLD